MSISSIKDGKWSMATEEAYSKFQNIKDAGDKQEEKGRTEERNLSISQASSGNPSDSLHNKGLNNSWKMQGIEAKFNQQEGQNKTKKGKEDLEIELAKVRDVRGSSKAEKEEEKG